MCGMDERSSTLSTSCSMRCVVFLFFSFFFLHAGSINWFRNFVCICCFIWYVLTFLFIYPLSTNCVRCVNCCDRYVTGAVTR